MAKYEGMIAGIIGILILTLWALMSQGCAHVQPMPQDFTAAVQEAQERQHAEINEACSQSAHRTRRQHTPVYTRSGMAVWCGQ